MSDPRERHPGFTPTDPPIRVMGAPMKTPSSVIPDAISEAKSAKFQVSLLLLIVLVAGAYYAGRDAGSGASAPEIRALMTAHDHRLEQIARSLEAIRDTQQAQAATVTALDARAQGIKSDIEVVRSHVAQKQ